MRRIADAAGPPELSIVIPAHNSARLIEDTVRRLAERVGNRGAEVIVVENGSTDDTWQRCLLLSHSRAEGPVSVVSMQSRRGMGNALRAGILASRGGRILLTADDLPFGFSDLDAADQLANSTGGQRPLMIIGSKAHPHSHVSRAATRGLATFGFAILRRWLLGSRVGDSQGTFLIEGDLARRLASAAGERGFLFTTELVLLAERSGVAPLEVPVRLSADHRNHPSRISARDVIGMAWGLLRLRWRHRRPFASRVETERSSTR